MARTNSLRWDSPSMRKFASNGWSSGNRSIQTSEFIIYATTNFLLAETSPETRWTFSAINTDEGPAEELNSKLFWTCASLHCWILSISRKMRQEIMHYTVRLGRMDLFAVEEVPDCTELLYMYNSNGMDGRWSAGKGAVKSQQPRLTKI